MAKADNTSFYVYLHRKKSNGQVFYVGKGHGNRAFDKHKRSNWWKSIVAKHGFFAEIIETEYQDWYASEREIELIAYYGRENLCNMTDGGDGASGYVFTDEDRRKISEKRKGYKQTDEAKRKLSEHRSGKKLSLELRKKLSIAQTGRRHTEETKAKISAGNIGKKMPQSAKDHYRKIYSKTIVCSNGMNFDGCNHAAEWLQENGWPKACGSNIWACCKGKAKTAYGFTWEMIQK